MQRRGRDFGVIEKLDLNCGSCLLSRLDAELTLCRCSWRSQRRSVGCGEEDLSVLTALLLVTDGGSEMRSS